MHRIRESHLGNALVALVSIAFIVLVAETGFTRNILGFGSTRPLPYDQGDTEGITCVAARICDLRCSSVPGGCVYTFGIEVFQDCWKPIYSINIEELTGTTVEPVAWPLGWAASKVPQSFNLDGSVVFSTQSDPVSPGSVQGGFGLACYSGLASLRWYPADLEGILVGRTSRLDLRCPTATGGTTWGSIKALYR